MKNSAGSSRLRQALLSILSAPVLLTGCGAVDAINDYIVPHKYGFFSGEEVNLLEVNYAAADYIIGQSRSSLKRSTPILIDYLTYSQNPDVTSAFAQMIPEQIGARMAQLGYQVKANPRNNGLSKPEKYRHALLTGSYIYSETNLTVTINMRLVDSKTEQIMGAYDYILPVNEEINDLLQVRPSVIRVIR